jgi:hypothetical protein
VPRGNGTASFYRDFNGLTNEERQKFREALGKFVDDLRAGVTPRASLRIRQMATRPNVFEFTWDSNGRATFEYLTSARDNNADVLWRRIGGHEIFNSP